MCICVCACILCMCVYTCTRVCVCVCVCTVDVCVCVCVVFCFDKVRNDFSQENVSHSELGMFEKIPQSTGFDPEMVVHFFGGNFTRCGKVGRSVKGEGNSGFLCRAAGPKLSLTLLSVKRMARAKQPGKKKVTRPPDPLSESFSFS